VVLAKYEYTNSGNVMTSQTDNADMLANNAYKQTMYETSEQEGDADKPSPEIPNNAPEKGKPNTQKRLCHKDMQDVPNVPDVGTNINVSNVQDVPSSTPRIRPMCQAWQPRRPRGPT
jgi:hypothetical protein